MNVLDEQDVLRILEGVTDPEIPVLNIVEMGIVRGADVADKSVTVRITPTYSGCPAMHAIAMDVEARLRHAGFGDVRVKTVFDEVWTTDWLSDEAREKLRKYGIAPPEGTTLERGLDKPVTCPRCGGRATEIRSYFGSTACKALHFCKDCKEPFEAFKCI